MLVGDAAQAALDLLGRIDRAGDELTTFAVEGFTAVQ